MEDVPQGDKTVTNHDNKIMEYIEKKVFCLSADEENKNKKQSTSISFYV